MPTQLTPQDLEAYLKQHEIDSEIILLEVHTPTVEAAAEAVSVSPDQIVKTLLFLVDGEAVLVIANGTGRIDRRLLGKHFGVSRKKTKFADPDTVIELTGYPVGAVPPIGHKTPIPALIDPDILEQEFVYGGGGADSALCRFKPEDILAHNQAEVVSLQEGDA
jgi:prolyl-tRNA editing enzyme YbaK/EbsC (Cys-tRNA(Pro) deacylase)